ncbi:ABC transporter permease [Metabacillus niabensis]|uniref:Peptide/nickel transport system permease protein n=1 Tax=Metabacillus niabensis TaxID=324854 RepID=A0ABT9Z019_9BACI|nr:ABC transporter permease [Metabacillus niabensis]MDQ0225599.1 peptide/nickel transport system permease protein [Metabacillus niabensis]PAD69700.1 peptide permease [Bacillus sp. 7586-K]
MFQYLTRRILISIPVLFGVTLLNFVLIYFSPGDPAELSQNPNATEADRELRREMLGLDDPFFIQYVKWLWGLLQGDLGTSFTSFQPVATMIVDKLGPTLLLMISSIIVAYLIAIPIGILSAIRQYTWLDYLSTTGAFLGVSIPNFFFGLGAIYIFGVVWGVLPTGGMNTLGQSGFGDLLLHLILPTLTLGTAIAGGMVRYVRSSVLEVLGQDFLRTARSKGLKEFVVINKHALKNALIPIITIVGMDIPLLIGGSVITETIFQWPGMGQLTIQSILSRDYPTLMAINLIAAVSVLIANIWADVMYAVVDPRVKYH